MRNVVVFLLVILACFSCKNETSKETDIQVLYWAVHQRKQNMVYERQDTLPLKRDFIELEELGRLKKSIIDTILSKKIENQEYKIDSLVVWVSPLAEQVYKDEPIALFNIFISDVKNGGEMNFVYSKKHGVLMQIYDSFNILALEKSVEYDSQMGVKREMTFDKLQTKLLMDTVIFPQIKVPPLPIQN
jgi:hypothetical protein